MTHVVELDDEEIFAIPQDKRAKILQAQIEGGRLEIAELYENLTKEHEAVSELEYSIRELSAALTEEKRKTQQNIKQREKVKQDLQKKRQEVAELENKLRALSGDSNGDTIRNSEIEKLQQELEKEEGNVLRYRALIEKRNNEILAVKYKFQGELEQIEFDEKNVANEKSKLLDLIDLQSQRLALLKERNIECIKSISSHALDAQLTATLEAFANN